jgi:hypothetical protein
MAVLVHASRERETLHLPRFRGLYLASQKGQCCDVATISFVGSTYVAVSRADALRSDSALCCRNVHSSVSTLAFVMQSPHLSWDRGRVADQMNKHEAQ